MKARIVLLIAQGFGTGLMKPGPGTFGTLLGLPLTWVLLSTRSLPIFLLGASLGVVISVWASQEAERILGQKDPGSVVVDEIVAVPWCFAGLACHSVWISHRSLDASSIFHSGAWLEVIGVLAAFRVFDIFKPWPIRQSQILPGGLGITVDDLLAAVYVNLCVGIFYGLKHMW